MTDSLPVWGVLTRAVLDGRPFLVLDLHGCADAEDKARTFALRRFAAIRAGELGAVSALEVVCGPVDLAGLRSGAPLVPASRMSLSLVPSDSECVS